MYCDTGPTSGHQLELGWTDLARIPRQQNSCSARCPPVREALAFPARESLQTNLHRRAAVGPFLKAGPRLGTPSSRGLRLEPKVLAARLPKPISPLPGYYLVTMALAAPLRSGRCLFRTPEPRPHRCPSQRRSVMLRDCLDDWALGWSAAQPFALP